MDCNIFIIEFYNKEGDKKTPSPHEWGVRGVESVADTFLIWAGRASRLFSSFEISTRAWETPIWFVRNRIEYVMFWSWLLCRKIAV